MFLRKICFLKSVYFYFIRRLQAGLEFFGLYYYPIVTVRLEGGGWNYGNVFVDGKAICNGDTYLWDLRDARVVCSMLNLPDAVAATTESEFGEVNPDDFGMWKVDCEGNEEDIRDCPHSSDIPSWACDGGTAAGVVCGGNTRL